MLIYRIVNVIKVKFMRSALNHSFTSYGREGKRREKTERERENEKWQQRKKKHTLNASNNNNNNNTHDAYKNVTNKRVNKTANNCET